MKRTRADHRLWLSLACLTWNVWGQGLLPNAGPPGWENAMTKLFGDVKTFTAQADLRTLDASGQETMSLAGLRFALLDERMRVELDMTQLKSAEAPAGAVALVKQMGLDRVITLIQSGRKTVTVIYPGLQACMDMPVPEEAGSTDPKDFKLEATRVGAESLGGQACVKNQVVILDAKGQKREALVWNATALKDFPLQVRFTEGANTMEVRFKEVQFRPPDAKQFEVPAGYTRYAGLQDFMQNALLKAMGGAAELKQ
jgi:hypothetical protein